MTLLADKPSKQVSSNSPSPRSIKLERTRQLMEYLISEHKLNQQDIRRACNLSSGSVSMWMNGKTAITDNNSVRLASYLGVRKERLIDFLNGRIEFEEVSRYFGEVKTIAADPQAVKAWMREIDPEQIWELIEEGQRILRSKFN